MVIKNAGNRYRVQTDDGRRVEATLKGNFRLKGIRSTNPVAVGDWVTVETAGDSTAFICAIEERRNYVVRRSSNLSKQSHILAANVDQAFLIATVNYPVTTTTFIDRFLATTEAYGIRAFLFFNKTDRYDADDREYLAAVMHLYETIGYPCYSLSARADESLSFMMDLLRDRVTLFSGHSGVGKSTIINRLIPAARQKVQEISEYHNKGIHTTTFSEMIACPSGGYVIDTPGIKGFGMFDMGEAEISHYFPEIFRTSEHCQFNNCTHRHEPGCAVRWAVDDGRIAESRYRSYVNMIEDKNENKYREAF